MKVAQGLGTAILRGGHILPPSCAPHPIHVPTEVNLRGEEVDAGGLRGLQVHPKGDFRGVAAPGEPR